VRRCFCCLDAFLWDLGVVCNVVCALQLLRSTGHERNLNGQREPVRNRRLVCCRALSMAFSPGRAVLLPPGIVCVDLLSSVGYLHLRTGLFTARFRFSNRILEISIPWMAIVNGRVAVRIVRWSLVRRTDQEPVARQRGPRRSGRGFGRRCPT